MDKDLRTLLTEFIKDPKPTAPDKLVEHRLIYAGGRNGEWTLTEAGRHLLGLPEDWAFNRFGIVVQPDHIAAQKRLNELANKITGIPDMVNQPPHYTAGGIECIDAIRAALTPDEFRGFCKGNAIKYAWREKLKGGDEDLKKAAWYLAKVVK